MAAAADLTPGGPVVDAQYFLTVPGVSGDSFATVTSTPSNLSR